MHIGMVCMGMGMGMVRMGMGMVRMGMAYPYPYPYPILPVSLPLHLYPIPYPVPYHQDIDALGWYIDGVGYSPRDLPSAQWSTAQPGLPRGSCVLPDVEDAVMSASPIKVAQKDSPPQEDIPESSEADSTVQTSLGCSRAVQPRMPRMVCYGGVRQGHEHPK